MDCVHGLDVAYFLQHLCDRLPQPIVIDGHKCLALLPNQLEKAIVIRAAQYGYLIKFGSVKSLVVIQKAIYFDAIQLENFVGHSAEVVRAKYEDRVFHGLKVREIGFLRFVPSFNCNCSGLDF